MKIKKMLWLLIAVVTLIISGCGESPKPTATEEPVTERPITVQTAKGSTVALYSNAEALKQFEHDAQEKFGGAFKIFRDTFGGNVYVRKDSITFKAVDPANTQNVDAYTWKTGDGFLRTQPVKVQTVGGGQKVEDFADYQVNLSAVKFTSIPTFVAAAEAKLAEQQIEGVKPITSVRIKREKGKYVFAISLSAARKDVTIYGDSSTGEIIKFEVK